MECGKHSIVISFHNYDLYFLLAYFFLVLLIFFLLSFPLCENMPYTFYNMLGYKIYAHILLCSIYAPKKPSERFPPHNPRIERTSTVYLRRKSARFCPCSPRWLYYRSPYRDTFQPDTTSISTSFKWLFVALLVTTRGCPIAGSVPSEGAFLAHDLMDSDLGETSFWSSTPTPRETRLPFCLRYLGRVKACPSPRSDKMIPRGPLLVTYTSYIA